MRYLASLLLSAFLLWPAASSATVLEIPLPALLGDVPADFPANFREVTVALPAMSSVNSVSFRLSGTHVAGSLECDGQAQSAYPLDISVQMTPLVGIAWYAMQPMPEEDGAFQWTEAFHSIPATGVSWDNLLDGEETISLWAAPIPIVGLCSTLAAPTGSVTEAVLILDYETTVTNEPESWSSIKALYR